MLSGRSTSFELKSFGIGLHVLSITSLPLEFWAWVGMGMEENKEDIGKRKREQIFFFFFLRCDRAELDCFLGCF